MVGTRWSGLPESIGRGLLESALALFAGIPLLVAALLGLGFLPLGIGVVLAPAALLAVRGLARRQRWRAGAWYGVPIAESHRPAVGGSGSSGSTTGLHTRLRILRDPATWRDLLWLAVNIPVGFVLGLVPLVLVGGAVNLVVLAVIWSFRAWPDPLLAVAALLAAPLVAWFAPTIARGALKLQALFCAGLLAPSRQALATRVEGLTRSRTDVLDSAALELRRIERDLHDGAQARLAALGMNIGLAEQLVYDRPDEAVQLLAEARTTSDQALADLRSLVRGILPPVLAERGLAGAVEALAAAMPLEVLVRFDPDVSLPAPAESALYFAIAEALANVAKHSAAHRAAVDVRLVGTGSGSGSGNAGAAGAAGNAAQVVARIEDDGVGGADPARGDGLRGVQRRLAAFDGAVSVASPAGGPTVVTLEMPYAGRSE